jgi:hypothetical protein
MPGSHPSSPGRHWNWRANKDLYPRAPKPTELAKTPKKPKKPRKAPKRKNKKYSPVVTELT